MTIHDVDDLHVNPDDTDDEEMDWEEVAVPVEDSNAALLKNIHVGQEPSTRQNIEITLRKHPSKAKDEEKYVVTHYLDCARILSMSTLVGRS